MGFDENYELVDRVADALVEIFGIDCCKAVWFGERLAESLSLESEHRWVPFTQDGVRLPELASYSEVNKLFETDHTISRIDREYRFTSRWFNPSRGD